MTPKALRTAVKDTLETVDDIGYVVTRLGLTPPWTKLESRDPKTYAVGTVFWEVLLAGERRAQVAAPRVIERETVVTVYAWLPVNERESDAANTQDGFEALVLAAADAIQADRYLGGEVDNAMVPQILEWDRLRWFRDKDNDKLCHFAEIQLSVSADVTFPMPVRP